MFRSILSKSLRDYRVPMLAWGIGLAVLMLAVVAIATPAVVTAYISLVKILSFWGDPYAMNTPEGYITFRYMETAWPLLLSIWPILAGARLVRGEEERGTMDVLLATPQTRMRLLLSKVGALVIALLVIAVLYAVGVVGGEAALGGGHVDVVRRDIGRSAIESQRQRASGTQQALRSLGRAEREVSTRTVGLHTLFADGWGAFWWLFGIVAICALFEFITPAFQKAFNQAVQQTPWLAAYLYDTPTNTNAAMLGTMIFAFMPALVVILALTLALKWPSDLENGRLELIFSTPQSRPQVLLERFGANVLMVVLAPILTWLALTIGAQLLNLNVNQGRLLVASFSMLPPALITIGLVYALAGRLRYGAVLGIVTAYLVLSYLQESLEGNIQFPGWLMSLSVFHLYGNPVFLGMDWTNFLGMTAVGLALLVIGLLQFRFVDIEVG